MQQNITPAILFWLSYFWSPQVSTVKSKSTVFAVARGIESQVSGIQCPNTGMDGWINQIVQSSNPKIIQSSNPKIIPKLIKWYHKYQPFVVPQPSIQPGPLWGQFFLGTLIAQSAASSIDLVLAKFLAQHFDRVLAQPLGATTLGG